METPLKALGINPGEYPDDKSLITAFTDALKKIDGTNLLLLDDVQKEFKQYQKKIGLENWHVLATSRTPLEGFSRLLLEVLEPLDAANLFQKHYGVYDKQDVLDKLLERVGYHSLGIKLLALSCKKLGQTPKELLGLGIDQKVTLDFEKNPEESAEGLLDYISKIIPLDGLSPPEKQLLCRLAFLPDEFISTEILSELLEIKERANLDALVQLGLVDRSADGVPRYRMHRLIKDWTEKDAGTDGVSYKTHRTFLDNLLAKFKYDAQNPDHQLADKPQWLASAASATLILQKQTDPDAVGFIDQCAELYIQTGQFQTAKGILITALKNAKALQDDSLIARQSSNLAIVLRNLGEHAEARRQLESALESDLENFGPDHPNVAVCRSNLANVLRDLGEHAEARRQLESALESDLKNFGPDHPNVATRHNNLAHVYLATDEQTKAVEHFREALRIWQKALPPEHPHIKMVKDSLAHLGVES